MIKISSGTHETLCYAFGTFFMKFISLLMLPILTHYLSPGNFGLLEVLLIFINLGTIIFGFGMPDTLIRFGTKIINQKKHFNRVYTSIFSIVITLSFLLFIMIFSFANKISYYLPGPVTKNQVTILGFVLSLGSVISLQFAKLRLLRKVYTFLTISILRGMIQAACVAYLLYLGYGVTGVVIASLISTSFTFIVLIFLERQDFLLNFNRKKILIYLRYSSPLVLSGLSLFTMLGLDQWWLANIIGTEKMAFYSLAMKFAMLTAFLLQPFNMWWQTKRFRLLESIDGKRASARIATYGVCLGILSGVIIGLISIPSILMLTPSVYNPATLYAPWLSLMWALKNAAEMLNIGCLIKNTSSQMAINFFCSALAILGYSLIIPHYHIIGLITLMCSIYTIRIFLFYLISQHYFYLEYPYIKMLTFGIFSIIFISVFELISHSALKVFYSILGVTSLIFLSLKLQLIPPIKNLINQEHNHKP